MLLAQLNSSAFDVSLLVVTLILLVFHELLAGISAVSIRRLRLALRLLLMPVLALMLTIIGIHIIHLL